MSTITPAIIADATVKQKKLTDSKWLLRCDELGTAHYAIADVLSRRLVSGTA